MVKQLARQKRVIPSGLRQFYRAYHRDARFPTEEKLEAQFLDISKTFDQVFLIMDAMDEFEDRKEFLSMITRFARDSSIKFKVFVTSRKEGDIENAFTRYGFPVIQIKVKRVDADIATFVRYEVEKRIKEMRRGIIDQGLQKRIIDTLTSKSGGMFLWVKYQLDYIYEQPTARDIVTALSTLPVDMDATYTRILRRIDKQVPAKREIARQALIWVICAKRPLRHEELAIAISIKPETTTHRDLDQVDDKEILLEACCNLLVFEGGWFRPFHYTVQEFLTPIDSKLTDSVDLTILQKYQITINHHANLAEICLQYLLLPELGQGQAWFDLRGCFPLLRYAAAFWYQHVNGLPELSESLAHLIDTFLDGNHEENLLAAFRVEGEEFYWTESINSLNYCLSFNILHLFERSHRFETSIANQEKYKEALHYAVYGGLISVVEFLVKRGFSINSYDNRNHTPLYIAALAGNKETLMFLLEKGADINMECAEGNSALGMAAYYGHLEVVRILLNARADVNAQGGMLVDALYASAGQGHQETVQMLLDRGANVNAQGGYYGNALQVAVVEGHKETVQMLLDRGVDVNAQGGKYDNALQAARSKNRRYVLKLLVKAGAREDNSENNDLQNTK